MIKTPGQFAFIIPRIGYSVAFIVMMCLGPLWLYGQTERDSTKHISLTRKAFGLGMRYITTSKRDTIVNESSVDVQKVYEGKIIRKIYIQHIGFERSIYDSTKRTKKTVATIANALHGTTKPGIIRQHVFLKENQPFNPYQSADNERYIRDLDFILDCRIVVIPIPEQQDSIDLSIVTKDIFSLGVTVGGSFPSAPEIGVYDANLAGLGQRVGFTGLYDATLDPVFTYATYYRKSSAFGSLANVEFGFTQLNTGISYGEETEYAYYIKASRPLVSPYSRMAGGLEFSRNWSQNVKQEPDSVFLKYEYDVSDVWLGYNFGINRAFGDRNRIFLAARFFDGAYLDKPEQQEYDDEIKYNSIAGYLTELTFYRQDFYRTRYVFGFGRTEDVPYGISLSASTGYMTQLGIERPYGAVKFRYSVANRKGNFYILDSKVGAYMRAGVLEDGIVNTTVSYVTRALNVGTSKLRIFTIGGYVGLLGQQILPPIEIHKSELLSFSADSVWGNNKVFIRFEPTLYTNWQFLGFRFAPFIGGSAAWLDCQTCPESDMIFYHLTGGVRTRNESLIFGTMELRFSYIPATEVTPAQASFGFVQRLTVKNSGGFVRPPSLVPY